MLMQLIDAHNRF